MPMDRALASGIYLYAFDLRRRDDGQINGARMKVAFARVVLLTFLLIFAFSAWGQILRQYHTVTAEVLAIDTTDARITFLTSDGRTMTLPVENRALEVLSGFSQGDPVTLSCRDYERGEHFAIFDIVRRSRP